MFAEYQKSPEMSQKTKRQNWYSLFLGLPSEIHEPNHYQLLEIEPFTDDGDVILDAATVQNRKLMKWQNSDKHHKAVRKLMMRVAEARIILSDTKKKKEYDGQLLAVLQDAEPEIEFEEHIEGHAEQPIQETVVEKRRARNKSRNRGQPHQRKHPFPIEVNEESPDTSDEFEGLLVRCAWALPIAFLLTFLLPIYLWIIVAGGVILPFMVGFRELYADLWKVIREVIRWVKKHEKLVFKTSVRGIVLFLPFCHRLQTPHFRFN